ncbi:hypothetical protein AQJ91_29410 [Streptomyces dysideae]|uniref:ESAT-6-like protein n=2 Tax=Streptomyces dysideae TaxID=909626 RepID=A0A101UVA2_9ACTN|nr:hypothetical protein AQJ91_29410 [Streptomyces dysideae]
MKRAESAFANAISSANREADAMDGVANNLATQWKGQAASTYQGALADWMAGYMACRRALTEMQQKLQQTTGQYTTTNSETIDGASQARSAMSGLPNFPI